MERILGIDTGTNSIGWAIVDYDENAQENKYTLIDKGVNIFQEGVKIEKGIESSKAAERTTHRRQRIGYWRRKLRKIALLRILIENKMCPPLSLEELKKWRSEKKYPLNEAFMKWQSTSDEENINPYYYRNLCLTEKLDLTKQVNRYIVGRAIYHINQRRGFLSNRKENTKESDGKVKASIDDLTKDMQAEGFEYLGQYFYKLYQKGEKIRNHYTSRLEHYDKELRKICELQGLSEDLTKDLCRVIITQRPLKSQKQTVGKCVYEPKKARCPISHPLYEQYRMYQFINSIKMQDPKDNELRFLNDKEKESIIPLFIKSKKEFKFEDIAKKISGSKKNICYYMDKAECAYRFNYYMDTSVSGCPVIAQLSEAFGVKENEDSWLEAACEVYTLNEKKNREKGINETKTRFEILNDIWHVLFVFDDEDKLKNFAIEKLQMDEEHATKFSKIHLPSDYAALSLKAIRKILPYMKKYGMIYSHAVFMANLACVVPCEIDKEALLPVLPKEEVDKIVTVFEEYEKYKEKVKKENEKIENGEDKEKEKTFGDYLNERIPDLYELNDKETKNLQKLYHPSMIEMFPQTTLRTSCGYYQLGSPRTNSMRNPMAMHSLFRIRHVINTLLKEGKIDEFTIIHIEFSRELNDSNRRAAVNQWQRENEKKNVEYAKEIKKLFGESYQPTDVDILKYKLWEEQKHICLYTGKQISISDLLNDSNKFDIEHTIPRSVGGDSAAENLTICESSYNRNTKRTFIPTQLPKYDEIMERISHWKEKIDDL
ncbi:MAG: CRISPR-associated protein Csn1 [Prevotella sp.]|nr:CRISPR-associated protein Csn1 [Prevotella sp.]